MCRRMVYLAGVVGISARSQICGSRHSLRWVAGLSEGLGRVPASGSVFFFSCRRRHTRCGRDWSSDVCSSDLAKKGWFAKANVASDFNNFHEGQLLFNRFTSDYKIFAFGLGSNTLNSSLSSEDVAIANAGGSAMASNISSGHPETYRSGVFFSQKRSEERRVGKEC